MLATATGVTVPFDALLISELNARKPGGNSLDSLVASIKSVGLINPLTVQAGAEVNTYFVIAGSRRYAAIAALIKSKDLPDNYDVPVSFSAATEVKALELTLAENIERRDMTPFEEFTAFARMRDAGAEVADIASSFHISVRFVNQRLKLAGVDPIIRKAFEADEINIESVMAFTLADVKTQRKVYKELKAAGNLWPSYIRKTILDLPVPQSVVLFNMEAYTGEVYTDLFGDEESTYLVDRKQALQLQRDHITTVLVPEIEAEGWSWVKFIEGKDANNIWSDYSTVEANANGEWAKKAKKDAGAIVIMRNNGDVDVHRGRMDRADQKALEAKQREAGTTGGDEDVTAGEVSAALHSNSHILSLQHEMAFALGASMFRNESVILSAFLANLYSSTHPTLFQFQMSPNEAISSAVQMTRVHSAPASRTTFRWDEEPMKSYMAGIHSAAKHFGWDPNKNPEPLHFLSIRWGKSDIVDVYRDLLKLHINQVRDIFNVVLLQTLNSIGDSKIRDIILAERSFTLADTWVADISYFERLTKSSLKALVLSEFSDAEAHGMDEMKKDVAVKHVIKLFADEKPRWIPPMMVSAATPEENRKGKAKPKRKKKAA